MSQSRIQANRAQSALWNARGGETWIAQQDMLDRLFLPFEQRLAADVRDSGARAVLDIGCGAGATTIAVARMLDGDGACTGIDISGPLIDAARRRAAADEVATAHFLAGDAQDHVFAPARFDAIVSRFGVMFFDDPTAAFANLRRAVGPGAGMTLITWRAPDENPFMVAAEQAAAPLLPQLPVRDPAAPGQFAFADPERVAGILAPCWENIEIAPLDVPCALGAPDLQRYIGTMGPVGLLLPDLDTATRKAVLATVGAAVERYLCDGIARFTAACWLVRARAR